MRLLDRFGCLRKTTKASTLALGSKSNGWTVYRIWLPKFAGPLPSLEMLPEFLKLTPNLHISVTQSPKSVRNASNCQLYANGSKKNVEFSRKLLKQRKSDFLIHYLDELHGKGSQRGVPPPEIFKFLRLFTIHTKAAPYPGAWGGCRYKTKHTVVLTL